MTPTYQYAQAGLEEYHHQVVSQAPTVSAAGAAVADPAAQFKAEQATVYATAATVVPPPSNGGVGVVPGVEQQTVRSRPIHVRQYLLFFCSMFLAEILKTLSLSPLRESLAGCSGLLFRFLYPFKVFLIIFFICLYSQNQEKKIIIKNFNPLNLIKLSPLLGFYFLSFLS